ncbi:hypothetical protein [Cyclobacterium roseum]|uniref:hypothetical protein n=1 Tax=Cyclobacterium roseum TaxID=2666137 RepID=UPI0013911260|nr:hypothetical protein [Cyclobacterium roseum]
MQKLVFIVLITFMAGCTLPGSAHAQSYGTALGLRLANNNSYRMLGLSAQQRIQKGLSAEAILQSDFNANTTVHALLKKHRPLISKRFNYYYGAGISLGLEESREKVPETQTIIQTYGNRTIGVDIIAGVEMTLMGVSFSVDYKPNVNVLGREPWYSGQVGISVRSVLVKGSIQNKKRRQKARKKRRNNSQGIFQKVLEPFKNN